MPSCQQVAELVSQAMDQDLPWRRRLAVRMHFWVCRMCERYARQIRFIRDIVHHYLRQLEDDAQFAPDLSLPAAARDRLRQRLREEPK